MENSLFKAKRIDNGEWAIGYYAVIGQKNVIVIADTEKYIAADGDTKNRNGNEIVEIDKSTLCRHTGLCDDNERDIWENDIIGFWDKYPTEDNNTEECWNDCIGIVQWDNKKLSFCVTNRLSTESHKILWSCTVIGNKFDNPELLEKYSN